MKLFLVFVLFFSGVLRCSCQGEIKCKYKYREKITQFLFKKNELSPKDTIGLNSFQKNVTVNFISAMDTCVEMNLYSVRMDSRIHSKTFFFVSDELGITFA